MRWEDERYVRVYTRDTADWLALSFDAQGLFALVLRKCDRAGIIALGKRGRQALPFIIGHPTSAGRIDDALGELLVDGCVVLTNEHLVVRNYTEAQEANLTDAARKRAQRERDRDKALAGGFKGSAAGADIVAAMDRTDVTPAVTGCHTNASGVTARDQNRDIGHESVTRGHTVTEDVTPSCAVPSEPAVPNRAELEKKAHTLAPAPNPPAKAKSPRVETEPPSSAFFDAMAATWNEAQPNVRPAVPDIGTVEAFGRDAMAAGYSTADLLLGYREFLADPYWQREGWPWAGWAKQWKAKVAKALAGPAPPTLKELRQPMRAEDVNWKGKETGVFDGF